MGNNGAINDVFHQTEERNQGITSLSNEPKIVPIPAKPPIHDNQGWQRFLAAYQSGKWELCNDDQEIDSEDDSPSIDLTIVHDSNGNVMNNIGK